MKKQEKENSEQEHIKNSKEDKADAAESEQQSKDSDMPRKTTEELQQQIKQLQKEKDDLFTQLQRISADYLNLQKRTPKHIAETVAYEKEKIISSLLPALDNFEHTLQNTHSIKEIDTLVEGIQIIYRQMLDILKSHGVEQIDALGKVFDPYFHQVMMQKSEPTKEQNTILAEYQKGYKLNSRVIRPSKVIINKLPSENASLQEEQTNQSDEQSEEKKEDPSSRQGPE